SAGDYLTPQFGIPVPNGFDSSRWHLGLQMVPGVFDTPIPTPFQATPFGWGVGAADYDNDGDADIIFYGGMNATAFVLSDNPGVILNNNGCNADFTWDRDATASSASFVLRNNVEGMALGDLNNDGFVDYVWAAGQYTPETIPLVH